jgi:hypothetical protein
MRAARWSLFALALLLGGCRGKLITTASLHQPGTASARFVADGRKPALWADTDAKWSGGKNSKPLINYEIDVKQGNRTLGHVSCSTGNGGGSSICGTHTNINGNHSADCEYSLACSLPPIPAGEVELVVTASKGPNVIDVSNMSLNVRAE